MATAVGQLVGSKSFLMDFYNSAALVAGQVVVREATASNIGEATNPSSTTSVTDMLGVLVDAASSNAAPTKEPGTLLFATTGLENIARLDVNPFAIYRFQIAGTAVTGTALTAVSPAQILTNTTLSAGGTVVTGGAPISTIDMSGGLIKGKSGNNAGSVRKMVTQVNSVSVTVGIAFVNPVAVSDVYIRVPYSRACITIQLTNTDFIQANGAIAFGTGAAFRVVNVIIDEQNSVAFVDAIAALHFYNKNS
jgi:hypothetical protein